MKECLFYKGLHIYCQLQVSHYSSYLLKGKIVIYNIMEGFVKAILQGNFDKIKTSMESLDVTLSINNKLKDGTTPFI